MRAKNNRHLLTRLRAIACRAVPLLPRSAARRLLLWKHPFDLRHGTDTGGLLYTPGLPTGHPNDAFNEGYYATAPSVFRGLIARWEDTLARLNLRVSDFHFIDLGCGKGRVVLLASELPFRSVTGIELHPGLCATARSNAERAGQTNLSVLCGDVLDLDLPAAPVVLFLFNSFGAEVMRPLLANLTAAATRRTAPIDLLCVHPEQASLIESFPGVQTLFRGSIAFSPEDALADAFGVTVDTATIHRINPTGWAGGTCL